MQPTLFERTKVADLPRDWRGYQRYDFVLIDQSDLEKVASQSESIDAMRHWVLSGGTLISITDHIDRTTDALGVGSRSRVRDSPVGDVVEARLSRFATEQSEISKQLTFANRYESMTELQRARALLNDGEYARRVNSYKPSKEVQKELEQCKLRSREFRMSSRVSWRPVAAGQVIAISKTNNDMQVAMRIALAATHPRRSPMVRRGVDPLLGDARYSRWLIPGVAEPPVYTFMGLLTVFVILVGPVAYYKTTKMARGYLMFAIAPLLALVTTLSLLTYGVVSDGFDTQARIRQLTWVDGKSGDALERVRATYFAGVSPAEGMRFPAKAEVMSYPYHEDPSWQKVAEFGFQTKGLARVSDEVQQFDSRFIPSRSQKQFVFHHPRLNVGRLSIKPATLTDSQTEIESTFEFDLRGVIICDSDGRYWTADTVKAGSTTICQRCAQKRASVLLGDMFNAHRPLAQVAESGRRRRSSGTRDLINNVNRAIPDQPAIQEGLIEQWIQEQLLVAGELPENSFFAVSDVTNDVVSVNESVLVASVRYVFGTLP